MSQRNDDEDNIIIQFKPRDLPEHPDLGFEKERKSGDRSFACDHRKGTWINFEERRLTCKECGAVIDPFDKIARMVREGWSLDSRIKEIREHKAQEAEQAKRTAELKKSKVSEKISALSEWLGDAGADKLPARIRKKLSEREGVGRPRKDDKQE